MQLNHALMVCGGTQMTQAMHTLAPSRCHVVPLTARMQVAIQVTSQHTGGFWQFDRDSPFVYNARHAHCLNVYIRVLTDSSHEYQSQQNQFQRRLGGVTEGLAR